MIIHIKANVRKYEIHIKQRFEINDNRTTFKSITNERNTAYNMVFTPFGQSEVIELLNIFEHQ